MIFLKYLEILQLSFHCSLEEDVFKRFEGEAGGELMKACVCMLEVSRHGLLETELLALLAEERNIKMPVYDPNAENLALEKTKNTTDDGIDKDVKENIKETQQNISKLVQETYVKEDKEGKDKKNVKCMDFSTSSAL